MISARIGALPLCLCLAGALISGAPAQESGTTYFWQGSYDFYEGQLIGGGNWLCLWLGYGPGYVSGGEIALKPKASTTLSETHSALVRSEFVLGQDWDISVTMTTDRQLRTKRVRGRQVPAPNPWEVAWLVADMVEDGSAGLYFILKTNGVELGAYKGNGDQIFLFTTSSPQNRIGRSYLCRLVKVGSQITAVVNGQTVGTASITALGDWPLGDRIGLYTEDAAVRFGPVSVVTTPGY
jgi:hypothetical protein